MFAPTEPLRSNVAPGKAGQVFREAEIGNSVVQPLADDEEMVSIEVKIGSDPVRKFAVRKYGVEMLEILKISLQQAPLTDADALRLTKKPLRMTLGAVFTLSKEHAQTRPAATPPKPKSKVIPLAPDKLIGDGSGVQKVYHKGATESKVPGIEGSDIHRRDFKDIQVKPLEPGEETTTVKIATEEMELAATVRKKGATIFEILHLAFVWTEFPKEDKLRLLKKPLDMETGAVFQFSWIKGQIKSKMEYFTWDKKTIEVEVLIPTNATIAEICAEVQKKVKEPMEDSRFYRMYHGDKVAAAPWIEAHP
jgi:hypothetical protein